MNKTLSYFHLLIVAIIVLLIIVGNFSYKNKQHKEFISNDYYELKSQKYLTEKVEEIKKELYQMEKRKDLKLDIDENKLELYKYKLKFLGINKESYSDDPDFKELGSFLSTGCCFNYFLKLETPKNLLNNAENACEYHRKDNNYEKAYYNYQTCKHDYVKPYVVNFYDLKNNYEDLYNSYKDGVITKKEFKNLSKEYIDKDKEYIKEIDKILNLKSVNSNDIVENEQNTIDYKTIADELKVSEQCLKDVVDFYNAEDYGPSEMASCKNEELKIINENWSKVIKE